VVRRRTTRYDECYRKLPGEFKTQQFKDIFQNSDAAASRAIKRLINDGIIEKVRYGIYQKLLQELP
jgi:predicted transcriptional regulator